MMEEFLILSYIIQGNIQAYDRSDSEAYNLKPSVVFLVSFHRSCALQPISYLLMYSKRADHKHYISTRGLFPSMSYHRKHLDLISRETPSTCYFSPG